MVLYTRYWTKKWHDADTGICLFPNWFTIGCFETDDKDHLTGRIRAVDSGDDKPGTNDVG